MRLITQPQYYKTRMEYLYAAMDEIFKNHTSFCKDGIDFHNDEYAEKYKDLHDELFIIQNCL